MCETYPGEVWCNEVSHEAHNSVPTLASQCCPKEEDGEVVVDCEGGGRLMTEGLLAIVEVEGWLLKD